MVLVGVQPVLMQVPPRCAFSMRATLHPWSAREAASGLPAWPLPMMIASYCMCQSSRQVRSGSLSWRDNEVSQADRNQVFGYGDENIFHVEAANQPFADVVAPQGPDHGANRTEYCSDQQRLAGRYVDASAA